PGAIAGAAPPVSNPEKQGIHHAVSRGVGRYVAEVKAAGGTVMRAVGEHVDPLGLLIERDAIHHFPNRRAVTLTRFGIERIHVAPAHLEWPRIRNRLEVVLVGKLPSVGRSRFRHPQMIAVAGLVVADRDRTNGAS